MTAKDAIELREHIDGTCPQHILREKDADGWSNKPLLARIRDAEDSLCRHYRDRRGSCADCWLHALSTYPDVLDEFNKRAAARPDVPGPCETTEADE